MCFVGIAKQDALAKARGEPTKGFHNIQPNYSNPEIRAAIANKKAEQSTKESAPPVLRSLSSSGNSSGLSIRRTAGKTKRAQVSSRSQSKSRRFSTR